MIILYTLAECFYSKKALELVKKLKIPYKNIVVPEKNKEEIKKKNEMKTFPQIFFKTKKKIIKIGGYDELYNIVKYLCKCQKIKIKPVDDCDAGCE